MADRVGLAASVITIAGCIGLTLRCLFSWGCLLYSCEAEIDVKALQDLSNGTTVLLNEVSQRNSTIPNPHLDINLIRARNVASQLKHILHQVRGSQNRSRFWRLLLWLRYGAAVEELQSKLRALKDEILDLNHMRLTKQTEKTLLDINHDRHWDITMLRDAYSNFNRTAEDWRTSLLSTRLSLEAHTMMTTLGLTTEGRPQEGSSMPYRGFLAESFTSSHLHHVAVPTNSVQSPSKHLNSGSEDDQAVHSVYAQPASKFELLKTFKPHKYVGRYKVPPVMVTAYYQESCSYVACVNQYRISYIESGGRWVYLNVSLEIPRSSYYWDLTQVTQRQRAMPTWGDPLCLPVSLVEKLRKCLENALANNKDNSCIKLCLMNDDICFTNQIAAPKLNTSSSFNTATKKPNLVTGYELFSWIRHTDCPRYLESEVFPWGVVSFPDTFVSYIGNKLVQEVKDIDSTPTPNFCYNIEILNSLRHVPEVLQLVGVTTDASQQRVKGYLVEWPSTKCQLLLHRASSAVHPWNTIETWARRLIRAIYAVHSQSFVVGTLRQQRPPILVDAFDNIYLHRFECGLRINSTAAAFYPPEYRQYGQIYTGVATGIDRPMLTPAYDLYQLGQILWILAESWATGQSAIALKAWFHEPPNTWSGNLYTGPESLPRLPVEVPSYYQDLVTSCSAQDPRDRLPCKDLLAMFPTSKEDTNIEVNDSTAEPISLQAIQDCRMAAYACNYCYTLDISWLYKCTICDNADFDICRECFDKGMHCYNPAHLLIEITKREDLLTKTRYYSEANKIGVRTIIEDICL